ncbi:MAG TPA: SDR family oxidoreductase [Solirubrobacteraceae bacterium]|nr:SDR family oxidoreductase [Solirubrobacteraceae bacterium]
MTELSDVRALVTGGTSGLGRAMVQALAQAGARVALTSRSGERAHTAAAELGAAVIGDELDVREPASVRAGVDRVYEQLGGLDLLVNNAGIGMRTVNPRFMSEPQPFWEVAPEGFADVFATKVNGAFHVARQVVPRMLAAGGGRIVTISMNEATRVGRGFVPYGPSGGAGGARPRDRRRPRRDADPGEPAGARRRDPQRHDPRR